MDSPKVNDGIHGPLKYDPERVKAIKRKIEDLKITEPISGMEVYLADTRDPRWNGKKESEKCNSCDVSEAGYKTASMCKGCPELEQKIIF